MEKFSIHMSDSDKIDGTKVFSPQGEDLGVAIKKVTLVHEAGELPYAILEVYVEVV